jgi:hypothetical protein
MFGQAQTHPLVPQLSHVVSREEQSLQVLVWEFKYSSLALHVGIVGDESVSVSVSVSVSEAVGEVVF